jgi:integrase/recombinase XerD
MEALARRLTKTSVFARLRASPMPEKESDGTEKLLTSREVATRLKLTMCALIQKRKVGRIPFIRISRWELRYRWSEILTALDSPREVAEKGTRRSLHVFANGYTDKPELRFRVDGLISGKRVRKYFRTVGDANGYAQKQNSAVGMAPIGKPAKIRGHDPPWLVAPYHASKTPWLKFRAYAKIDGKTASKFFETAREALRFANDKNNELALEAAHARIIEERLRTAPAVKRLQTIPQDAPLTSDELTKAIQLTNMRRGAYKVKLCNSHPRYKFIVDGSIRGKRERKYFSTEAEAKSFAHLRNTELLNKGIEGMDFPAWLRVMAQECHNKLSEHGATIDDATRHYLAYAAQRKASCTLRDLIPQLIKSKHSQGLTRAYVLSLKCYMIKAIEALGPNKFASEITTREINEYLESLSVGLVSRNCIRMMLCTTFSFARQNGYCLENPAYMSIRAKEVEKAVGVYAPKQLAKLLENATADWVPFIAIGAFAGLRVSELGKLDWSEVNLEEGFIHVPANKAKSARRRIVRILPNLDAWIRPYAKLEGPVAPVKVFSPGKYLGSVMRAAGIKSWEKNGLRHSFASYHLAHFRNIESLALEMGHRGTDLIFHHYRRVVTETDAKQYWAINPMPKAEAAKIATFNRSYDVSGDAVERERQAGL